MTADPKISKADILGAVERRIYSRALDYAKYGKVDIRDSSHNAARAVVNGTYNYVADFSFSAGRLAGRCTCQASGNEFVCKHVVATALVHLEDDHPRSGTALVATFLDGMSREELVRTILDQTVRDQGYFDELMLAAMSQPAAIKDASDILSGVRMLLRKAVTPARYNTDVLDDIHGLLEGLLGRHEHRAAIEGALLVISRVDRRGPSVSWRRNIFARHDTENDHEEEDSRDHAIPFIRTHAEAMGRLGASPGYLADHIIGICEAGDFMERVAIYDTALGCETSDEIRGMRGGRRRDVNRKDS
jgi:hypothetical protein